MSSLFASTSRIPLRAAAPRLCRTLFSKGANRPIPNPRGANQPLAPGQKERTKDEVILTPTDFLTAIGRSSQSKLTTSAVEDWPAFWKLAGPEMKKAGVAVRDRKYIMWCMSKYRQGLPIDEFAREPTPKKLVRGRGPRVQNGKLLRSRRPKL